MEEYALTRQEEAALRHLYALGYLPDSVLDSEPYARLGRLGLIEPFFSDALPSPKKLSAPGLAVISVANAVRVSDKGKSCIAELDRRRRDHTHAAVISIVSAVIGSAVTLLATNFSEVIVFFQRLFHGL